jgi:hypothetical protein
MIELSRKIVKIIIPSGNFEGGCGCYNLLCILQMTTLKLVCFLELMDHLYLRLVKDCSGTHKYKLVSGLSGGAGPMLS